MKMVSLVPRYPGKDADFHGQPLVEVLLHTRTLSCLEHEGRFPCRLDVPRPVFISPGLHG